MFFGNLRKRIQSKVMSKAMPPQFRMRMGSMPNMGNPFSETANPFVGLAALPEFNKTPNLENLDPMPEMRNLEKVPPMSKEMFLPSLKQQPQMPMMPPMGLDSLPKMPRFRLPSFM